MDTLDVGGDKCVDLAFVPANSESYGFTGRLYITLDGNYAVKKVLLNTPANINLNWVDKLRIEQEFKADARQYLGTRPREYFRQFLCGKGDATALCAPAKEL